MKNKMAMIYKFGKHEQTDNCVCEKCCKAFIGNTVVRFVKKEKAKLERLRKKNFCMSCGVSKNCGIIMYHNHNDFLLCHFCMKSMSEINEDE